MSSSNFFTEIKNVQKEDTLNAIMQPDNVFPVQGQLGSIQLAINTAVAQGYNQWNPAVILVSPDSSTGTSVTDVQFVENITLYDGIYLMSQVPGKAVYINGTLSFGSTALGTQPDGVVNSNLRYLVSDMSFIANGGGAALFSATTAVATRGTFTRVNFTNTGTAAANTCFSVNSASVYTLTFDNCVLTTAGNAAGVYAASFAGGAHVVTIKGRSAFSVTGVTAVNSMVVDNGAGVTATDSDFTGLINLGANAVSTLTLNNCRVNANVAAATGLITFAANNASIAKVEYSTFSPLTHVNIFTIAGSSNIIRGGNCIWNNSVTNITAINSGAVAALPNSWWYGNPVVPKSTGVPANALAGMLWADTSAVTNLVKFV